MRFLNRLKRLRWPGRVFTLRAFLFVLSGLTLLYLVYYLYKLTGDYQKAGSLVEFWEVEWESGKAFLRLFTSGFFQTVILVLGWSLYLRLRMREHAHIRLRRSEQKYRTIINHAGEAIFLLDSQGLVLEWNKAAENLFNLPRRLVLNQRLSDLHLDLDLDLPSVFDGALRTQRSLSFEVRKHASPDSQERMPTILNLTINAIRPGSGLLAERQGTFVVIARDITSEKHLETRMGQAEKLAGIGQLAAGIAHQLNTPLGSILLSAQMVEEDIEDEDAAEDIRRIIRQTEQCRGIIKGLLNFARPTGSGRSRVDLAEVIKETSYLMEKNLKVASVEFALEEQCESWVYGNRNELEQVFFNLLANAIDALEGAGGGEVRVTIRKGDPGEIMVLFADTGEGIAKADQEQVFLPFFTTKDYGKGTGLGLSIVARIVHEHGGRIELDSRKGLGSVFSLSFPEARNETGSNSLIDDSLD
jgi:two-component system NtrC family sensor kinase